MPRWNKSLENNCKEVMDKRIKNICSILYHQLLQEVLISNLDNNKNSIEIFLRKKLNIPQALAKHTKGYWLARGWSEEESYIKSKENKQKNIKSTYSQQTWLDKINPVTGVNYTVVEADFERNSRRPIRKEYWIKQGYTEEESIELAHQTKVKNNKKGSNNSKESNVRRVTSKRCIEYFVVRGYSESEASLMVSNNQTLFSKEICIEKYGLEEGTIIWRSRQDSWQATLNSKSDEEKARINRLKLGKGYVVSKAENILLQNLILTIPSIIHQFTLVDNDKKQYVYDFMFNNKIIEYNGDFWHCNPKLYASDFVWSFLLFSINQF